MSSVDLIEHTVMVTAQRWIAPEATPLQSGRQGTAYSDRVVRRTHGEATARLGGRR